MSSFFNSNIHLTNFSYRSDNTKFQKLRAIKTTPEVEKIREIPNQSPKQEEPFIFKKESIMEQSNSNSKRQMIKAPTTANRTCRSSRGCGERARYLFGINFPTEHLY
ncbi:uncharacterized protein G2W53_018679 [Senna tora]|uniref:Uncharacterized protein n=1 Tax=Senna tora TaxID=362788 RepID=A0A834TW95_9FABA|nr:uncharacterized protein G2W53_018679 [Senna tora]